MFRLQKLQNENRRIGKAYESFLKKICNKWIGEWERIKLVYKNIDNKKGEKSSNKQYWWLLASPKIWSFSKMKVGDIQDYTLYNENGNPRRVFQTS